MKTETEYTDVITDLILMAVKLSPGQREVDGFHRMLTDIRADGGDSHAVVESLLNGMLDGIRYGNWPSAL